MLFKCKVCSEKDKRITELNSQIEFLRKMLGETASTGTNPSPVSLEADGILSGQQHIIQIDEPQEEATEEEIDDEATRLLSGNY
jgi:hypothetical protein